MYVILGGKPEREIVITEWALDAYLQLVAVQAFTREEYKTVIRPDVMLLQDFPKGAKFRDARFWSHAPDPFYGVISQGYRMKWHSVGDGKRQLRLPVGMLDNALLFEAYIKRGPKQERRMLARFKTHLQLACMGRYVKRGVLP
ncbi:MAG: hypothetical protein ACPGUV_04645 [Polyangiales bacterium]